MARPALATLTDLEDLLGCVDDETAATARLAQASEIVRAYAGMTWLNADETAVVDVPGAIPGVVAAMVERATRNPSGTVQETAGPFSRSFGSSAAERLYMTKAEKMVVRAASDRSQIGVIPTTRGPLETRSIMDPDHDSWVENEPSLPAGWPQ